MFSLQELSAVRSHYYAPRCFRRRSRCCFTFVNGRPLNGTVWVQNDDFRLCRDDMLLHTENKATKCSDKISHSNRHILKKTAVVKDGTQSPPTLSSLDPTWKVLTPPLLTTTATSWLPMKPKSGNVSKSKRQESLHPISFSLTLKEVIL